jgi:hypothetical protein
MNNVNSFVIAGKKILFNEQFWIEIYLTVYHFYFADWYYPNLEMYNVVSLRNKVQYYC